MPIINRKRRAQAEPEAPPPPTRRRRSPSVSEASSIDEEVDGEADGDTQAGSSHDQMVKKLVRLALASEYSRQLVRRTDITSKVMAPNTSRQFKHVFSEAQDQLRSVFGMEMTELPQKEKVTIGQKRTAARAGSQPSSSSKAWILTSTLPASYRQPKILSPPQIPSTAAESSYVGFVTFVLTLIYLSPSSSISEARLEKHMKRMNADNYVLSGEKTEKVLKRMEREQYIMKVKERDGGGEETVDYVIGPRGKVEVGERGVAGLVRKVYAKKDAEADELERRLIRSLGDVVIDKERRVEGEGAEEADTQEMEQAEEEPQRNGRRGAKKQTPRRSSERNRRRTRDEEDEEEDDGEEVETEDDDDDDDDDDE
ncbi:hypothetical protein N7G274_004291 [Stereocaulon virgatum]|uniref:MAGE domain-containing protein n=1 Tax=Stereocaulon virgatum TaxID=373712 RepID=A0ABR4AED1_9LECA